MTKIFKGSNAINRVKHNDSIVNISIPNVAVPKRISNKANSYKTNTVADIMDLTKYINNEMQKAIDKASNYLKNREHNYNKEIRKIQGILKRTKSTEKIKAYNKRIKELNRRIGNIQNTREKRVKETEIKYKKIATKVQIEKALQNGENTDRANLANLQDIMRDLDTQTNALNNPISASIFIEVIRAIFDIFYEPGIDPTQTDLFRNCMLKANDSNLTGQEDYDNLKEELLYSLTGIYNQFFANRGRNTTAQFVMAVVVKGEYNEGITHVI